MSTSVMSLIDFIKDTSTERTLILFSSWFNFALGNMKNIRTVAIRRFRMLKKCQENHGKMHGKALSWRENRARHASKRRIDEMVLGFRTS